VQLARLPSGRNSRTTKKKEELLDAVDTLSCHLLTTFTALASAFAQNTSRYPQGQGGKPTARADVAVVLGPSITGARARVLLSIDGLEVKIWGHRDYDQEEAETDEDDSEGDGSESVEENTDPESDQSEADFPPSSPPASEMSSEGVQYGELLEPPEPPLPQRRRQPFSPRPSGITQSEETQVLNAAERLLSRTLANACAEEDNGLGSEMGMCHTFPFLSHSYKDAVAPTQTYILVRAPRRFSHPSWIPRQNLTVGLDAIYTDFLERSGISAKSVDNTKFKSKRSGIKTEGIRVVGKNVSGENDLNSRGAVNEEDDMIWWSWDGKIVGFADW
jgi:hypothetical protein